MAVQIPASLSTEPPVIAKKDTNSNLKSSSHELPSVESIITPLPALDELKVLSVCSTMFSDEPRAPSLIFGFSPGFCPPGRGCLCLWLSTGGKNFGKIVIWSLGAGSRQSGIR